MAQTLLLVDDTPANLGLLVEFLDGHGFEILVAENGLGALEQATYSAPDLILLDIMMPTIDGFETCRRLKANPKTESIPVIFMSALHETPVKGAGFEAGGVDYVTKPIDTDEVLMRIRTHCALADQRRRIEDQNSSLNQKNAELLALNEEKNGFLQVAAHDLKNPLSSVMMSAEIILNDPDLEQVEREQMLRGIVAESHRMARLITNLLDLNAIEQGKMNWKVQSLNLYGLLSDTVGNYQKRAKAKQQQLNLVAHEAACPVMADVDATERVLDQVISNAIKYSPHHGVIRVEIEPQEKWIQLCVCDNGPGLSGDDQKKLFGKFSKLTPRPTGGEGSTGLGLSIAKNIMERLHGNIWCESTLGQGCKFILQFPRS